MDNGEEEDQNVKYWRTKYELLAEDFRKTKERTEGLEDRLLEIVEENEKRECEKDERIRQLDGEIEESRRRIEQLEAACFRYKNQRTVIERGAVTEKEEAGKDEDEKENIGDKSEEIERPQKVGDSATRPISIETPRSSMDGITRSPDFHAGEHVICEYHKLPVLAKNEGFIYGFRWNIDNKIHIV